MLDGLRTPFFIASAVCCLLVVLIEAGAGVLLPVGQPSAAEVRSRIVEAGVDPPDDAELRATLKTREDKPPRPGYALSSLAMIDGLVLLTVGLMLLAMLIPDRVHGRIQGAITLILSLLSLVTGVIVIFVLIGLLLTMLGLFLAVPFGTIAYLAIWGFFDLGAANATSSVLLLLKVVAAACLVLAHQRFLQNKGLVLIVLTSLLASVIVSFLHGLVPSILVSIADVVAALIVLVLGCLWALFLLIGSLVSVFKALRFEHERA